MQSFCAILLAISALSGSHVSDDPVDEAKVLAAAQRSLEQHFPDKADRLEVRLVRTSGTAFGGDDEVRIRFSRTDVLPRAHTQARLLVEDESGAWEEAGWALLYVAHFDSVAVSAGDFASGASLDPGDVTFAWMETTSFRGEPVGTRAYRRLEETGPLFAARPLRTGRPLRADDVRTAYAAETGESLIVVYRRGVIEFRLTCKAREPGVTGDVIRVYSPDTRSTYRARLTGPGAAEWVATL